MDVPTAVTTATTVPALFLARVAASPDAEAFRNPSGRGWATLTWRQTADRVRAIASGLAALGLALEERCAIVASTRVEWILVDLGILCAGGATTTVYPSSTGEDCAYILADSETAYAFVEDRAQLAKLRERRAALPRLRRVVLLPGAGEPLPEEADWVLTLEQLEARGRARDEEWPDAFEQRAAQVRPGGLATLIYTSGTTGRPKGVELVHDAWVAQAEAVDRAGILDHPDALQYFWLPLSHVFGKMIGTAQLRLGFPTAVDGRVERIVENLAVVRPTFLCAVPRVFEKVHNKIYQQVRAGGAVRQAVFRWALGVGRERAAARRRGRRAGPWLAARWWLADRLAFQRVRSIFGGRLQFFVSGSAPLAREVIDLFEAAGLLVLEGYGLTESSAATHVNLPGRPRPGTVGPPLPGIEARLADDGEVLMRGRWIMRAYHNLPEATAEALEGGWLHTGDVGTVDADGYLTITDRKKDLIKTSGGKFVAPQELEGKLKAASPLVSQALVHGDRRAYPTALVTLDPEALRAWAAARGLADRPAAELAGHKDLRAELQRALDAVNATVPRYATVRRFTVLPAELTEAAGEVTPSQKLKRKVVEERHRAALDAMYSEALRGL